MPKTIENIEKNDNPVEKESNPILTIKMTPNIANSIREYNKSNAYDNDSLTCYDNKENGVTKYNNIYCYSDYLDKLKKDYSSNITFSSDRLAESSRTDEKVTKSKYWTIWTTIDGVITSSPNDAGGPSWQ